MNPSQKDGSVEHDAVGKLFAIHKEVGPTSHDLMYQIKRLFPGEKIGHAGTLDPLASGILVVGVGRSATKLLHTDSFNEKEYIATITFGASSTTDDAEGEKTPRIVKNVPTQAEIEAVLKKFVGTITQLPPTYSAIKVKGTPAYKLARRGQAVELATRPAQVFSIKLLTYDWPQLSIKVVTGRGVYIRSLARDVGDALGVGGYISTLERTRVGRFTKADVVSLAKLGGNSLASETV